MATDQPHDSASERDLSDAYRGAAREVPPAKLDAAILAQARAATAGRTVARHSLRRWTVPASAAAAALLAVGVVLQVTERESPAPTESVSLASRVLAPAAEPAPHAEVRERFADSMKVEPDGARRSRKSNAGAPAAASRQADGVNADVVSVDVRGQAGAYEFSVGVRSPDRGCDQYANWWEVLSEDGRLLYRRVLLHSHVDEQPFVRSGGPIEIQPDTVVWVRAHLNTTGYGGAAFKGTARSGFVPATLPPEFSATSATQPPLPDGCAF